MMAMLRTRIRSRIGLWGVLALVVMALAALGGPARTAQAATSVQVCTQPNYGACYSFTADVPDFTATSIDYSLVRSLRVPAGAAVTLFNSFNYQGVCEMFTADTPDLYVGRLIGRHPVSMLFGQACPTAGVELCSAPHYAGACRAVPTSTPDLSYAGGAVGNGATQSLAVAANVTVSVYRGAFWTGICETFQGLDPTLADNSIGINTIVSVSIGRRCDSRVQLCAAIDYVQGCEPFEYDDPDLRDNTGGIGNDAASSLKVPAGMAITVYSEVAYGGRCQTFGSDMSDLRRSYIGNDTISSVRLGATCADRNLSAVKLVAGDTSSIDCGAGWTKLDGNLNEGAGGKYIYLCVQYSTLSVPIYGIGETVDNFSYCDHVGPRMAQDVNEGTGGPALYICAGTRAEGNDPYHSHPIQDVQVVFASTAFYPWVTDYTRVTGDLNERAGGKFVYIYVKLR